MEWEVKGICEVGTWVPCSAEPLRGVSLIGATFVLMTILVNILYTHKILRETRILMDPRNFFTIYVANSTANSEAPVSKAMVRTFGRRLFADVYIYISIQK